MTISVSVGSTVTWQDLTSFPTSATFTNVNGGTAFSSGSYVVIAIAFSSYAESSGHPFVTVGGSSATFLGYDGNDFFLYFYGIQCGSNLTDTVVISDPGTIGHWVNVGAWILTGAATSFTQTYGTNFGSLDLQHGGPPSDPVSIASFNATYAGGSYVSAYSTLTVPTGGCGLVALYSPNGTAGTSNPTPTWTTGSTSNITSSSGDITANSVTNPVQLLLAHTTTAGTWGPLVSGSPAYSGTPTFGAAMVAATFAPPGSGGSALASIAIPRKMFLKPKRPFILR